MRAPIKSRKQENQVETGAGVARCGGGQDEAGGDAEARKRRRRGWGEQNGNKRRK